MSQIFETIDKQLADWIGRQHLFFVATAPLASDGSVNCSPKGGDSFRILGDTKVAYQDLTGSGVETIAHLRENGRIVVMFCAFEGPPRIVRLHGRGSVITREDPRFETLAGHFPDNVGTRSIILISLERISDSCGFGVPMFAFKGDRDILDKLAEEAGEQKLKQYRSEKNTASIDGLPGIDSEGE